MTIRIVFKDSIATYKNCKLKKTFIKQNPYLEKQKTKNKNGRCLRKETKNSIIIKIFCLLKVEKKISEIKQFRFGKQGISFESY